MHGETRTTNAAGAASSNAKSREPSATTALHRFAVAIPPHRLRPRRLALCILVTPPEVTNTGPSFNRGSGGGARGCGFGKRVGVHARSGGVHFL